MPHTNNKTNLRASRITYISVWLIVALIFTLSEFHILPIGYLPQTPSTEYMLNMLCIVLTLSGVWGGLKLFSIKSIRSHITKQPQSLPLWNVIRIGILGLCTLVNLIVYYALLSNTTALYCLLITLTAFVFCWPKHGEVE